MADGDVVVKEESGGTGGEVDKSTILSGDVGDVAPVEGGAVVVADNEEQIAESARIAAEGTDEEKATEAARIAEIEKPGDEPIVPEKYDFIAPEGMEINTSLTEAIEPIFKDLNLTQEQANKFTEAFATNQQALAVATDTAFVNQMNAWNKELKEDAVFGGEKFEENSAQVSDFIKKTIPDDVKDEFMGMLFDSGIGNHPAVVKYLFSLSSQFSTMEDNPGGGGPLKDKGDIASRMYAEDGSPTIK